MCFESYRNLIIHFWPRVEDVQGVSYTTTWLHGTHETVFHFLPNSNKHIGIDGFQGFSYPSLQIIH